MVIDYTPAHTILYLNIILYIYINILLTKNKCAPASEILYRLQGSMVNRIEDVRRYCYF